MRQFHFHWIPFIATCLLMAVFLRLGWWQWSKGAEVEQQMSVRGARTSIHPQAIGSELVDAKQTEGLSVVVRGRFDASGQFFLDNQQHQGRPGVHVITPLQIEDTQVWVLVNRGWVGWGTSRGVLPQAPVPTGLVEVYGRAVMPSEKAPAFVSESVGDTGTLHTRIRLNDIQANLNQALQPIVIWQTSTGAQDGLVREWPEITNKAPMHKGYAAQWFLMSVLLLAFFIRSCYRKVNV